MKSVDICPVCKIDVDLSKACNSSFFVIIDPTESIRDLLHISEKHYVNIINGINHCHNSIADFTDGTRTQNQCFLLK